MNTHNKNGQLTAYGFACGYIQKIKINQIAYKELFKEHGLYIVRFRHNDNEAHKSNGYETLQRARQAFKAIKFI